MILLVNTCGADAVVALAEGNRVVAEERLPGRKSSEQLIPTLRRLLPAAGQLEAVGVVVGPGSFTGVRVGLSAAKGLCEARACGMIGMSRLQLVALEAQSEQALAVLDAGRGEFFCGFYRDGELEQETIVPAAELSALARGRDVLTCEPRVQEVLSSSLEVALVEEPAGFQMLNLVRARLGCAEWTDVAAADANYLRRTDAELLMERR